MVTITGFKQRESADGKKFIVLELEGGIQVQTSSSTGKPYATVSKATLPCTFDQQTANELVGTTLPGTIIKEDCEPYSFISQSTNEEVTLTFKHVYKAPENASEEQRPMIRKLVEEIDVL